MYLVTFLPSTNRRRCLIIRNLLSAATFALPQLSKRAHGTSPRPNRRQARAKPHKHFFRIFSAVSKPSSMSHYPQPAAACQVSITAATAAPHRGQIVAALRPSFISFSCLSGHSQTIADVPLSTICVVLPHLHRRGKANGHFAHATPGQVS